MRLKRQTRVSSHGASVGSRDNSPMSVRGLTIRENLISRVSPQYFAFRNTSAVVVVQSFVDMEAPGASRAAYVCTYTQQRERTSERERGVPLNQTSNRGACRANEIHRSTQLTNCPAAPPFTPSRFHPSHRIVASLIRNHAVRKPSEFRRISPRALLRSVFRSDHALPSLKKNATTAGCSLLVNNDSRRRTFSVALFRGGYGKRLKLVLFVYTFVTCFTAPSFLARYGVDVKCMTKVLLRGKL